MGAGMVGRERKREGMMDERKREREREKRRRVVE